ncbi:ATP-binding protein [Streptomyces sp. NPDC055186]
MTLTRQRRFPRARNSVRAARAFALETLRDWGYQDRHDDVRLCVSELTTNALVHGVPPGREFSVALAADGPLIRIEVRDSGGGQPEVVHAGPEECGGRGLHLVTALADDFGTCAHDPGKTVWAVFKTTSQGGEGSHGQGV